MKRVGAACALALCLAPAGALAQAVNSPGVLVNKLSSTYRTINSYHDSSTLTLKAGGKETAATVALAAQRPNRFFLEVKGEKLDTLVASDGSILTAVRPDKKVYSKTRSPQRLMGADVLAGIDQPSLGAQVISQLLAGTFREGPFAPALAGAKLSGPSAFGSKLAYGLSFTWQDDEVRVYVTSDDMLVRRVVTYRDGAPIAIENHENIEVDKPIAAETFAYSAPAGYRAVAVLPPLAQTAVALAGPPSLPFTKPAIGGRTVSFPGDYKGKLVMLDFWATWCGPCIGEVPGLVRTYRKYHDQGFEVLGISLDRENAEGDVVSFTSEHGMPWAQIYDGGFWDAAVAKMYKINAIPAAFLVDGSTGAILASGNSLRGESLDGTIAKALAGLNK